MPFFSLSRNLTRFGAGLGNELIPAAKSYLAAKATKSQLIPHCWSLNPRGYGKLFQTNSLDILTPLILRSACHCREITPDDWKAYRIGDYGALAAAVAHDYHFLNPFRCLISSGMWGGYAIIDNARDWVRTRLASAVGADAALAVFHRATHGHRLRIGIHLRRGDFAPTPSDLQGRFNVRLPTAWYAQVIAHLAREYGKSAVFCLFGDGDHEEKRQLLTGLDHTWTPTVPGHDTADLLALASCDLLVCSASSYSLMAAWLGRMPYIWMQDQMVPIGNRLAFGGHEADQGNWMMADALTRTIGPSPCLPIALDGPWHSARLNSLLRHEYTQGREADPLRYGAA